MQRLSRVLRSLAVWPCDLVAWGFAVYTFIVIAVVGLPSVAGGVRGVMAVDDRMAFGLTYRGADGAGLAFLQLLGIAFVLWLSKRRSRWLRRAAHVCMIGWAALWLGNALWMESLAASLPVSQTHPADERLLGLAALAATLRCALRWNDGARRKTPPTPPPHIAPPVPRAAAEAPSRSAPLPA